LDAALCGAIQGVLARALVYGYRKVLATLLAQGWLVNHKKVLRHTRALGLTQPRKVKGHQFTRPALRYPTQSNEYWEMDLSYVWCGQEQAYLFVIIDAYDKCLPGAYFGSRCRADEAILALTQAVQRRFGGRVPVGHQLTLRIDRGTQFKAKKFRKAAQQLGVVLEYAGIQCPDDKPYIESFIGKYKTEEVYRNEYRSLSEGMIGWEVYRSWHQYERVHQELKYRTPQASFAASTESALVNEAKECNIINPCLCPD
jgi:putative transposase